MAVDAEKFNQISENSGKINDHGPIKWFLGFEIKRDRGTLRTIAINQRTTSKHVEKLDLLELDRFDTKEPDLNFRLIIPIVPKSTAKMRDPIYESHWECIVAVVVSRPDAAYAIGILSQFAKIRQPTGRTKTADHY